MVGKTYSLKNRVVAGYEHRDSWVVWESPEDSSQYLFVKASPHGEKQITLIWFVKIREEHMSLLEIRAVATVDPFPGLTGIWQCVNEPLVFAVLPQTASGKVTSATPLQAWRLHAANEKFLVLDPRTIVCDVGPWGKQ
jgi:hypothetical protein